MTAGVPHRWHPTWRHLALGVACWLAGSGLSWILCNPYPQFLDRTPDGVLYYVQPWIQAGWPLVGAEKMVGRWAWHLHPLGCLADLLLALALVHVLAACTRPGEGRTNALIWLSPLLAHIPFAIHGYVWGDGWSSGPTWAEPAAAGHREIAFGVVVPFATSDGGWPLVHHPVSHAVQVLLVAGMLVVGLRGYRWWRVCRLSRGVPPPGAPPGPWAGGRG